VYFSCFKTISSFSGIVSALKINSKKKKTYPTGLGRARRPNSHLPAQPAGPPKPIWARLAAKASLARPPPPASLTLASAPGQGGAPPRLFKARSGPLARALARRRRPCPEPALFDRRPPCAERRRAGLPPSSVPGPSRDRHELAHATPKPCHSFPPQTGHRSAAAAYRRRLPCRLSSTPVSTSVRSPRPPPFSHLARAPRSAGRRPLLCPLF
jgi:hypothetical protein